MLNPLKDLFAPKYALGLEITDTFIGAVQIFNSLKGSEIDRIAFREVENPEALPGQLQAFFREENLKPDTLITCLPASSAVIRQIPLSFAKAKKLGKIIKYQMEPYAPFPVDDMVVDYLPPAPDGKIITIGVRKEALVQHLTALSQAELEPGVVGIDDVSLFSLCVQEEDRQPNEALAVIHFSDGNMGVQVIREKRLDFIRILPLAAENTDQLMKTFKLYQLENPDVRFSEIRLTGHSGIDEDTAGRIAAALNIETFLWRPFDGLRHGYDDIPTVLQAKLSVPLGLALSAVNPADKLFDLRKEEFAPKGGMDLKKTFVFMLTAFLLLIFLFTFNVYQKVHIHRERHTKLKDKITQVFSETFPEIRTIVKGKELDLMKQKIDEETGKHKWLAEMTTREPVLDVLTILTRTIAAFPGLKLDNLSVEEKDIRLYGRAATFETVDRLKQRLSNAGLFKTTRLVDAKMDKKAKEVRFNFALEKK